MKSINSETLLYMLAEAHSLYLDHKAQAAKYEVKKLAIKEQLTKQALSPTEEQPGYPSLRQKLQDGVIVPSGSDSYLVRTEGDQLKITEHIEPPRLNTGKVDYTIRLDDLPGGDDGQS